MSPPRDAWTRLEGPVLVRQSVAFQMNSVVLLDAEHTVIVDPGVLPSELDDIAREVATIAPGEVTLCFTHAHWDHVLGRPWWPEATTLAHDRFARDLREQVAKIAHEAEAIAGRHGERWSRSFAPFAPSHAASGLHVMRLGRWHLVLRDAPGHCDSQFTLHVPEQHLLIAADMLSDIEIPTLDQPPSVYRRTLEPLLLLAEHGVIETLVPGHGSIARGAAAVVERFQRDVEYLARLESGVRETLGEGLDLAAATQRLDGLPDIERHPDFPMLELHRENVRLAYDTIARDRAGRAAGGHRSRR